MRIPVLLLASLAACAPANSDHRIYGTWEVREVTGRPSEVFAPGRTLQLMEGPTALVSGEGMAPIRQPFNTLRTVTVHGTEGLVIQFATDLGFPVPGGRRITVCSKYAAIAASSVNTPAS